MRSLVVGTIAVLLSGSQTFADWQFTQRVSKRDDSVTHVAVLIAEGPVGPRWGMHWSCSEGKKYLSISILLTGAAPKSDPISVTWRTDKDKAQADRWFNIEGRMISPRFADLYLDWWSGKQKLWIELLNGNDATFEVSKLSSTIAELKRRCNLQR